MTKSCALQKDKLWKQMMIFTVLLSLLLTFFCPLTAKAAGGIELSLSLIHI